MHEHHLIILYYTHRQSNEKGLATEVDDVTTQYRFIHTASSFVFCTRVSASKTSVTDSHFCFFVYYSVRKHLLKPQLTQNDNMMEVIYITHVPGEDYYRKTQTNIMRENHVKCFEVFSRHIKVLKSPFTLLLPMC